MIMLEDSNLPPTAKALRAAIVDAFGSMPYPGDDRIVDDYAGYDPERDEVKRVLKGHHWRDVSFDMLDNLRDSLPFLSPEGFRFYVPAFMIYCITDFSRSDVASQSVINNLTIPSIADFEERRKETDEFRASSPEDTRSPPDELYESALASQADFYHSGEKERFIRQRLSGFCPKQGKVIRLYLEYMRDEHGDQFMFNEPQIAIDRYWHQF